MHRFMLRLAQAMAIAGGLVLSLLILLTCVSIIGRELNALLNGDFIQGIMPGVADAILATGIGPINGDFELVEAGIAFSIFAFIPLTQVTAGHATVDIFTSTFPAGLNRWLRAVIEVAFAAVLVLIAMQLFQGMMSKLQYGETSFLLQFPVWWAFAASFFGAAIAAFCGVYMAGVRIAEAVQGRVILSGGGAEH